MSLKAKIYSVVFMLVLVALVIGIVGVTSMRKLNRALKVETDTAFRVSKIKGLQSSLGDVPIGILEIVLSEDLKDMQEDKAKVAALVGQVIDPAIGNYTPIPENAEHWKNLQALWLQQKEQAERIYQLTFQNTEYKAATLSTTASLDYWLGYKNPLRRIAEAAKAAGTPEGISLAFNAMECLETMNGLQLHEKLAVVALNTANRDKWLETGREELKRFSANLNQMERKLTNPEVTDDQLKAFNADFNAAGKNKVKFADDGTASYAPTRFNRPANFLNPAYPEASRIFWEEIKPMRGGGTELFNKVYELASVNSNHKAFALFRSEYTPTSEKMSNVMGTVVKNLEDGLNEAVEDAYTDYRRAWWILILTAIIGLLAGIVLSILSVNSITRALDSMIGDLSRRSQDVERISGQLADGSESLANGSNQQASSLAETSSALEEMASMTRQNADNARETQETAAHSLQLIASGSRTVHTVTQAMGEISESSEKISNIIKTIEEIAFQTNLLALNAAVEAARAGEAGKGFAVVADEVRNLASRSAQAAKDTSELIQGTVERVRVGSGNVQELSNAFKEIETESQNVGRLVTDISAATNEQAQGVDQVNTAVAQMDKVTQTNASTAEESAAAAAELSEQSQNLNAVIGNLGSLVYGRRGQPEVRISMAAAGIPMKRFKRLPAPSNR